MTDAQLAARVRAGEQTAFDVLSRRYRWLIRDATRYRGFADRDDLHQEALLGLYTACQEHDPTRRFASYAVIAVRTRVYHARERARAAKHLLLTRALRLEHPRREGESAPLRELVPDPIDRDPQRILELREELRDFAANAGARAAVEVITAPRARRRRFAPEQIARALALVAEGHSPAEAGAAVGAHASTVTEWRSKTSLPARHRPSYTPEQRATALALVAEGRSLRAAGAAVGASKFAVGEWVRKARATPAAA